MIFLESILDELKYISMDQYNNVEGYSNSKNMKWETRTVRKEIKPEATAQDRSQT